MSFESPPPRILMLQGPASRFPAYLSRALIDRGAEVDRVIFCPGDRLFGLGGAAPVAFRARPEAWPTFVSAFAVRRGITDLVCLGDGRSWHREAIDRLGPLGIRIHVIEQGYVRPGFLTVEPDGTGGNTAFPRHWAQIAALARGEADVQPPTYLSRFAGFAAMDVAYNLANLLVGRAAYPHYRTHAIDGPLREWAGWIGKAVDWPLRQRRVARCRARIAAHTGPVFLFALQLETDFQIRLHGPREGLRGALARTIRSFAEAAPPGAMLAIKPHPLDNGWARWGKQMRRAASEAGVPDRVVLLEGGGLDNLFPRLTGVVTINSTSGLSAMRAGVPVIALGTAIYDLPGLTHSGALNGFWQAPARPDPARVRLLVRALCALSQIPGNFDGTGARPGAEAMARKILTAQSAPSRTAASDPSERIEIASSEVS